MTEQEAQQKFLTVGEKWLGDFGERVWEHIFKASGIRYIPLHKINNGGAPMLEGKTRIVLPDFECIMNREPVFVEVKAKTQSVIFRRQNQQRHGINYRNFKDYIEAAYESSKKCGIALIELFRDGPALQWSGSLLVESLGNLGPPIRGFSNQSHMVYWPRKRFCDLDSWSALELLKIWKGQLSAAYPVPLTGVFTFTPRTQGNLFDDP